MFICNIWTSARASADSGVSSAGLTTTVQPAARAAPTFLVIIALGKFHCRTQTDLMTGFTCEAPSE